MQGSASAGFDRPMLLLRKPRPRPAAPAAQQEWCEAEYAAEQRWQLDEGQWAAEEQEEEEAVAEEGWQQDDGWQDESGDGQPGQQEAGAEGGQ